jgi:transcription antitermination factor NusG
MDMPTYRKGQRVRVINGIYKGAEGYIKKIKSDRKLLVALNGVAVVAVSYIPSAYLESLEEECDIYNFQNRV